MIQISKMCTGCMACRNICPVQAIGQTVNEYGFVMPIPDASLCVACGKCEEVCPLGCQAYDKKVQWTFFSKIEKRKPVKAYAMYHRSREVVRRSSSGGAFYGLASVILKRGGIVFGCYYDVKRKEAYLTDTDHLPLERLLTSKYVESYIGYGYRKVKKHLETGREVLFCGTPCQAAGLRQFLGRDYENLLVVDFTCGAVTAQKYLRDYLLSLEKRFRSKVKQVNFRNKHYGWGQYCFWARFDNGRVYRRTAMSDPYFFCFLRSSMQRLSCHDCRFAEAHFSDVVLADFWKCEDFPVESNGRRGISLVLAMTEKGRKALEGVQDQMHMEELDLGEASYNLKGRSCPRQKIPEIYAHQACASRYGVTVLRRRLLSPGKRLYFAFRQFVMDHPRLAVRLPGVVGDGQIMRKADRRTRQKERSNCSRLVRKQ